MKKNKAIRLVVNLLLIGVAIVLTGCSLPTKKEHVYVTETYDTVIAKWKTDNGDTMQLSEDGTYYRTGKGYSEKGTYVLDEITHKIGESYRNFALIIFQPDSVVAPSENYYYTLNGKTLELSRQVSMIDGSYPTDKLLVYKRQ